MPFCWAVGTLVASIFFMSLSFFCGREETKIRKMSIILLVGLVVGSLFQTHRVSGLVEVGEQEVEHDGMTTDEVDKSDRVVAIIPDHQLEGV
jgi:hypothetical protein